MLKKMNLKLFFKDEVESSLDLLKKYLKEKFNFNESGIKIFSKNSFEIIFPLTHRLDEIIIMLDKIIVYLRDSLKICK